MRFLVTGGSGFIGNHLVKELLNAGNHVLNVDKLTRVSNRSFRPTDSKYKFCRFDINDAYELSQTIYDFAPHAVFNLAALSNVESSINDVDDCFRNNISGLENLLKITQQYVDMLSAEDKDIFRFIQVSTDEVYGSLEPHDPPFTEVSNYAPNTPYAASKAAGDMLVRCYQKTYGLPAIITHCTNNFGTHQHPEKFIPKSILKSLQGKPVIVYGNGEQIRDWIHVSDHVAGLLAAYQYGTVGVNYLFGSGIGYTNNFVAQTIIDCVSKLRPSEYSLGIKHVTGKGHDFRYAVDCAKTQERLNWKPEYQFTTTIEDIVNWYVENVEWLKTTNDQH